MSGATATGAVVLGVGQPVAGDDGVGLAVARALRARGLDARECADASLVLALLGEGRRVVLVDALRIDPAAGAGGPAPGAVLRLEAGALAAAPSPLSSHGLGVAEAMELARALYGEAALASVAMVAVAIAPPTAPQVGLSVAVAAAVEPAAALAASLAAPLVAPAAG